MTGSAPLIAFAALDILALVTLIGALACRLWLLPVAEPVVRAAQAQSLSRLTAFCLVVLTATSPALLATRAQDMSGAPYAAIAPIVPTVLFATHYGHFWLVRGASVAVLWLVFLLPRTATAGAGRTLLMLAAAAVLAFTRSASGHAADAGDFSIHEIVDWLHLLAASLWAGGVIAAALTIFPAGLADQARAPRTLANQGVRISRLATAALAMVLATGIYNAWITLGHWDALWGTLYGQRLLIKLALVAAMLVFGAANRFLHLTHSIQTKYARRFAHLLYGEAVVALAVVAAAALMINTAPPRPGNDMGANPPVTVPHPARV